jgi:xanthine dehydrogenase molybdopterin-binding subunit B
MAAIECCKIINERLDPVKKLMPASYTWPELIAKAFTMGIDLSAHSMVKPQYKTPLIYNVYGASVSEAIIDVLTGETQVLRVDMLYDCGQT